MHTTSVATTPLQQLRLACRAAADAARGKARSAFARALLRTLRVRVIYREGTLLQMTRHSPCVVVSNHVSLLDGIMIALSSPVPLAFGVDTEFSRGRSLSAMVLRALSKMGYGEVIPLDSHAPFGVRQLRRTLALGRSVMIFPEGAISPRGARGEEQAGLAWLAQAGATVVRLKIRGAERSRWFAKRGDQLWPRIWLRF